MKVVYGEDVSEMFGDKYIVLELDTFMVEGEELPAWSVISAENISLGDLPQMDHWKEFHAKMINGYKTQQWNFVLDCVSNLRGKWGGEIDSFYDHMEQRVKELQLSVPDHWTPVIHRNG